MRNNMADIFTKGEVDRLGNLIRENKNNIDDEILLKLQAYRTSHKELLSSIFNFLCKNSNSIHPQTIVTYRIKRIESIIGKLNRYPEMRFSRMWDIGGCRCIARNDSDVYKIKRLIANNEDFEIVKEYDYLKEPQDDGYKSLHLFVKKKDGDKVIEVQIRNKKDHDWATLVEITDLLFGSKLKELGKESINNGFKDLYQFHHLLSKDSLDLEERRKIASVISKYKYFEKLSDVFTRNILKVRSQWLNIENKKTSKYFLIETSKDEVPKITAFTSSSNAEMNYFEVYKTNNNANIVLIHLQNPNYNQICIAYSNYILTFHSFLIECLMIIENLIIEALLSKKFYTYYKTYTLYSNLQFNSLNNLTVEIGELIKLSEQSKFSDRKKESEWVDDIRRQLFKIKERSDKLRKKVNNIKPNNIFSQLIVFLITYSINKRFQNRINKKK